MNDLGPNQVIGEEEEDDSFEQEKYARQLLAVVKKNEKPVKRDGVKIMTGDITVLAVMQCIMEVIDLADYFINEKYLKGKGKGKDAQPSELHKEMTTVFRFNNHILMKGIGGQGVVIDLDDLDEEIKEEEDNESRTPA